MTEDRAKPPSPGRRRAWVYAGRDRPGLRDLFSGGTRRKAFVNYWLRDNIGNALDLLGHFSLKLLPMDMCSAFGARLGVFAIPRFYPKAERRARATIAELCPHLSEAAREALLIENCKAQGRLMTEFSVVNRIARHPDRLSLHGLEIIEQAIAEGPTIIVGLHLGNWEIGPIILKRIGVSPHSFYVPPHGRAKEWIAERVRRKAGLQFLPPGLHGIRPAVKALREGEAVSIFCDEGFGTVIRGPFFGRPAHMEGNIALAVRLARMTGATICPWYNIRTEGFRFEAHALPAIKLPPETTPGERALADMLLLNSVIEPVVRAHLDQWYFLDNSLRPS